MEDEEGPQRRRKNRGEGAVDSSRKAFSTVVSSTGVERFACMKK